MKKNNLINVLIKNYYILVIIIILIIIFIIPLILYYTTHFEKKITIKDKYTRYRKGGSNYNIVDMENNIYQIGNVWFKFDFNRAEDYNKLEKNKTYNIKGYGIRIPILDMYKNIYYVN
tara:strand:- start:48 stop:401 length:354 start_codon:yes stop_codon:yes gene_type:complete